MAKKKNDKKKLVDVFKIDEVADEYAKEIEENPEYSLEVDPENKYGMNDVVKTFISNYMEYRDVKKASAVAGITPEDALAFLDKYDVKKEIRRLSKALYHRYFCKQRINMDELNGYLSSILTDDVPICDRVSTKEKLQLVVPLLIKINEMKQESLYNPNIIMQHNIDLELKDLSVKTINQLLTASQDDDTSPQKKEDLIDKINEDNCLSPEEKIYLKTLSTKELLNLLKDFDNDKK